MKPQIIYRVYFAVMDDEFNNSISGEESDDFAKLADAKKEYQSWIKWTDKQKNAHGYLVINKYHNVGYDDDPEYEFFDEVKGFYTEWRKGVRQAKK